MNDSSPMTDSSPPNGGSSTRACVGIDIGGTSAKLGIVNAHGVFLARDRIGTAHLTDPLAAVERLSERIDDLCQVAGTSRSQLVAVGLAVPGILDARQGILREVANLPKWSNFSIAAAFSRVFGDRCVVANDANCAAFAEFAQWEGPGDSLALVTLGTGIGCGVVLGGHPFSGDFGCGGEIGHAVIDVAPAARLCGCGKPGHLEAYAGATGLLKTAREALGSLQSSSLRDRIQQTKLTPEIVAQEAEAGDAMCRDIVQRSARYLGMGLSILAATLNPSCILLGGAMNFGGHGTQTGRDFLASVRETLQGHSLKEIGERTRIDYATLGSDAGMLGAAELARRSYAAC